jgi:hypothetical protein
VTHPIPQNKKMEIKKELIEQIKNKVLDHHKIYRIPIKAEYWEDIVDSIMGGDNSNFVPFNHSKGFDIEFEIDCTKYLPQLKSGVIENNRLYFPSHRLSRFLTLEEKLDFLNNLTYDHYIFLARDKGEWNKKYHIHTLETKKIDFNSLNWIEVLGKKGRYKNEVSGWQGTNENNTINCKIVKSMSHQLWVEVDLKLTTLLDVIEIC